MRKALTFFSILALIVCWFSVSTLGATTLSIGFVFWDVNIPPSTGQFDIANETGANSSFPPDTTFPVTTPVNLSSLSLVVDFSDGSTTTFGSSYFTLDSDGLSFDGSSIALEGTNPSPTSATLTGAFSPLAVNSAGVLTSIDPTFLATISPDPGNTTLVSGDLALIEATTVSPTPAIPEPGTGVLAALGIGCVAFRERKKLSHALKKFCNSKVALP